MVTGSHYVTTTGECDVISVVGLIAHTVYAAGFALRVI